MGGLGVGIIIWGILMLIDIIISVETSFCTMPPSSVTLITTILGALAGSVFWILRGNERIRLRTQKIII